MNQFKSIFLANEKPVHKRVMNSQKCIRVSGKHNDLEEVGLDTYHHTFFEMMGNWSFGDYYKEEAIEWAWKLLTKEWEIDQSRLWATVYDTDDESFEIWKKVTDIDENRILRFGKKYNFRKIHLPTTPYPYLALPAPRLRLRLNRAARHRGHPHLFTHFYTP